MTTPVELMLLLRLLLILLILLLAEDEGLGKDSTLQCAPERGGSTETTRVFRLFLLVQLSLSASGSEIKPLRPGPARCPIAGPGVSGKKAGRGSASALSGSQAGGKGLKCRMRMRPRRYRPSGRALRASDDVATPGQVRSGMLLGRNPGP